MKKAFYLFFFSIFLLISYLLLFILINSRFFYTSAELLGYSKNDILVIIHADDVGLHKDVTDATFQAMDSGICKSASVMVPCPDFERTIAIWKTKQHLDLGIHLTLTCEYGAKFPWSPVLPKSEVPSLYNPEGLMWPSVQALLANAVIQEATRELEAQIVKVLETGVHPTHIDAHMGCYNQDDELYADVIKLAKKYSLQMRVANNRRFKLPFYPNNIGKMRRLGYVFPNTFKGFYYIEGEEQDYNLRKISYYNYLRSLKPGVHEILTHNAFHSSELQNLMGKMNCIRRQSDFDIWTSQETKDLANKLGIIFIQVRELYELQLKNWQEGKISSSPHLTSQRKLQQKRSPTF